MSGQEMKNKPLQEGKAGHDEREQREPSHPGAAHHAEVERVNANLRLDEEDGVMEQEMTGGEIEGGVEQSHSDDADVMDEREAVEDASRSEDAPSGERRRTGDASGGEAEEYAYELKIPHERIAVLIGRKGGVKKRIEDELGVRVEIDSREGDVRVTGTDPLKLYTAREIIRAIARGFSPQHAFELLKQDYVLDVIPITDYARTRNALVRLRGRVIGEHGRSRRTIEQMTGTWLSVYGKTVGIIGRVEDVSVARRAVEMLLGQAQHAPVYKMLEKYRAEQRRREALWLREEDELREALREEFQDEIQ